MKRFLQAWSSRSNEPRAGTAAGEYKHAPLEHPREIRLIKLHPAQESVGAGSPTTFAVSINTVSIDKVSRHYLALSYVWGDSQLTECILSDDQPKGITFNLYRALWTISCSVTQKKCDPWKKGKAIYLWADGLCINQDDLNEKASHIKLRREIFAKSKGVIAYLSAPTVGDPRDAILGLCTWLAAPQSRDYIPPPLKKNTDGDWRDWKWSATTPNVIRGFWASPWFVRAWVTQEVVLAPQLCFMFGFGPQHAIWPELTVRIVGFNVGDSLPAPPGTSNSQPGAQRTILVGFDLLLLWQVIKTKWAESSDGLPLSFVLSLTKSTRVTEEKDKIYATLGMLQETDRKAVTINYSAEYDTIQLLVDVAAHCVKTGNTLDVLSNAYGSETQFNLPSWVPHWGLPSYSKLTPLIYKCSRDTGLEATIDSTHLRLSIRGSPIDRIQELCPTMTNSQSMLIVPWTSEDEPPAYGISACIMVERAAMVFLRRVFRASGGYPTHETLENVV